MFFVGIGKTRAEARGQHEHPGEEDARDIVAGQRLYLEQDENGGFAVESDAVSGFEMHEQTDMVEL